MTEQPLEEPDDPAEAPAHARQGTLPCARPPVPRRGSHPHAYDTSDLAAPTGLCPVNG